MKLDYAVTIDVELFELIALTYTSQTYKPSFVNRVNKFLLSTDGITGCLLAAAMTPELIHKVVKNDKVLSHLGTFIHVHSPSKVYAMLGVRYKEDLRRLELRMDPRAYAGLIEAFKRG
jgi:hypothetical protein